MYFYIVDPKTRRQYTKPGHCNCQVYTTRGSAKGTLTKLQKANDGIDRSEWVVVSLDEYKELFPTRMVKRTNLMSGLEYEEAENTPNFCSPSSEAYWSM